jgi:hypothetical protein
MPFASIYFGGTFFPLRLASERPMAIACFRLFTFFPLRPLRKLPFLHRTFHRFLGACSISRHAPSTLRFERRFPCVPAFHVFPWRGLMPSPALATSTRLGE